MDSGIGKELPDRSPNPLASRASELRGYGRFHGVCRIVASGAGAGDADLQVRAAAVRALSR